MGTETLYEQLETAARAHFIADGDLPVFFVTRLDYMRLMDEARDQKMLYTMSMTKSGSTLTFPLFKAKATGQVDKTTGQKIGYYYA